MLLFACKSFAIKVVFGRRSSWLVRLLLAPRDRCIASESTYERTGVRNVQRSRGGRRRDGAEQGRLRQAEGSGECVVLWLGRRRIGAGRSTSVARRGRVEQQEEVRGPHGADADQGAAPAYI